MSATPPGGKGMISEIDAQQKGTTGCVGHAVLTPVSSARHVRNKLLERQIKIRVRKRR